MILEYFEAHRAFRKALLTATASAAISAVSAATAAVMDAAPEVGITAPMVATAKASGKLFKDGIAAIDQGLAKASRESYSSYLGAFSDYMGGVVSKASDIHDFMSKKSDEYFGKYFEEHENIATAAKVAWELSKIGISIGASSVTGIPVWMTLPLINFGNGSVFSNIVKGGANKRANICWLNSHRYVFT